MNQFTGAQLLYSCILACIFGIAAAVWKKALQHGFCTARTLFQAAKNAVLHPSECAPRSCKKRIAEAVAHPLCGVAAHIADFCDWWGFGIGYLLVSYAALDGILRLYVLLLALGSRALVLRTIGRWVDVALRFVLLRVAYALTCVLYLTGFPIRAAAKWLWERVLRANLLRLRRFARRRFSRALVRKKLARTDAALRAWAVDFKKSRD